MLAEIAIFIFWTSFFAALSAKEMWTRGDDALYNRLSRILKPEVRQVKDLFVPDDNYPGTKGLKEKLVMAGLRTKKDLEKIVLLKRICLLVPIVLIIFLACLGAPVAQVLLVGGLFVGGFIVAPRLWIFYAIFNRRKEIERNLPNTLDLLILGLEAGLSFDSALIRVAEESKRFSPHTYRELTSTHHEVLAGKSREEALKNLAWRCGVPDLNALVGAILQSVKLGTSLVKTLRVQSETMRKKRKERIRSLILKTPVKLIFPLLFLIFPTLLVVILGPSFIKIFRTLSGLNAGG